MLTIIPQHPYRLCLGQPTAKLSWNSGPGPQGAPHWTSAMEAGPVTPSQASTSSACPSFPSLLGDPSAAPTPHPHRLPEQPPDLAPSWWRPGLGRAFGPVLLNKKYTLEAASQDTPPNAHPGANTELPRAGHSHLLPDSISLLKRLIAGVTSGLSLKDTGTGRRVLPRPREMCQRGNSPVQGCDISLVVREA